MKKEEEKRKKKGTNNKLGRKEGGGRGKREIEKELLEIPWGLLEGDLVAARRNDYFQLSPDGVFYKNV